MFQIKRTSVAVGSALMGIAAAFSLGPIELLAANDDLSPSSGKVIEEIKLKGYDVLHLKSGVRGQIIGIADGYSTDRYQVHVKLDLGEGEKREMWVHYRPNLPAFRQAIQIFDANGEPTTDIKGAQYLKTIRSGVSAWSDMDHSMNGETNMAQKSAANPSSYRKVAEWTRSPAAVPSPAAGTPRAASPVSSQALVAGQLWNVDCEDFIEPNGNYGSYGKYLYSIFGPTSAPDLYKGEVGDIQTVCAKYPTFDDDQRRNFWVWFAASVAMIESDCNPELNSKGLQGRTASGLWQLDLGHTASYCAGVCGTINARDANENLSCGIRMLNWYTGVDVNNPKKIVYWEGNYWESLHARGTLSRTSRLINSYHACH